MDLILKMFIENFFVFIEKRPIIDWQLISSTLCVLKWQVNSYSNSDKNISYLKLADQVTFKWKPLRSR